MRRMVMFTREKTLAKAKSTLEQFAAEDKSNSEVISDLQHFLYKLELLSDDDFLKLKSNISTLLSTNGGSSSSKISVEEVAHSVLVAIAAFRPFNKDDPVTQEPVDEATRIVTSDGFQFDGESLLMWMRHKNGKMLNPLTNKEFEKLDQMNIKTYAAENKIDISPVRSSPQVEDPGLLRSALASMGIYHPLPSISIRRDSMLPDRRHDGNTQHMRAAVNTLRSYGLTLQLIREHWQCYDPAYAFGNGFTSVHRDALIYLVTGHHPEGTIDSMPLTNLSDDARLTPAQAIDEVSQLNMFLVEALVKLYVDGLRGHHLRSLHNHGIEGIGPGHEEALVQLIKDKSVSPERAVELINGKSPIEAREIAENYTSPSPNSR